MAKVREITANPAEGRNYFSVDADLLVNKHIRPTLAPIGRQRDRIQACREWWKRIDAQLDAKVARVYVPDADVVFI